VASGNGRRAPRSLEAVRGYLEKSYLINMYAAGGQVVQTEQADELLVMSLERVIARRCRRLFASSRAEAEAALVEGVAQAQQILEDVYEASVLKTREELQKLLAKLRSYEGKLLIRLSRLEAKARAKDAEGLAAVREGDAARAERLARDKVEILRKIEVAKARLSKIRRLRAKTESLLERISDLPDELMVLNFKLGDVEMDELMQLYRTVGERLESISRRISQMDAVISSTLGDAEDPEVEAKMDAVLEDWIRMVHKEEEAIKDTLSRFRERLDVEKA